MDLEVLRVETVTDRMLRLVLGGPDLESYNDKPFTDLYVKIQFPLPDEPGNTVVRTYTVRHFDIESGELWVDVVQHGTRGIGGPWVAAAQPGDRISLRGPGGKYRPDPTADWHLFVGDPAAFPAIARSIESLNFNTTIVAVLRAHDANEASYFDFPSNVQVTWLLDDDESQSSFIEALQSLELPSGDLDAFVHGELRQVQAVRSFLTGTYGISSDRLSLSGYWRAGLDEQAFQQAKRSGGGGRGR